MKTINIFYVTLALGIAAAAGLAGCASDQPRETTQSGAANVDDTSLAAQVKNALQSDSYKYPLVNVTTANGSVQLSGFVDDQAQKDHAGEIAKAVPGVKVVSNAIAISTARDTGM